MSKEFDARAYGRDLDFSRPFFEQFAELAAAVLLIYGRQVWYDSKV